MPSSPPPASSNFLSRNMSADGILRKDQLEVSLHNEKKLIEEGVLKEDNPLDVTDDFRRLCEASRRGDLKVCQEMIQAGVNINAKDTYDYTPLILASLCGHYETVQLLLESGALCERDTFQGERCLYNALNDRIRNLLLSYDYSKSTDPLQPLASHLTSLLFRTHPKTSDITITSSKGETFNLHKFVLAARSPFFRNKFRTDPDDTVTWKLPNHIPPPSFGIVLKQIYLGELPRELGGGPGTGYTDDEVLLGLDKISDKLEIKNLSDLIIKSEDRRLARQKRQDEVSRGGVQLGAWFQDNVIRHAVEIDTSKADDVKWDRINGVFADVLLRADEDEAEPDDADSQESRSESNGTSLLGIPGTTSSHLLRSSSPSHTRRPRRSKLYPCHKAMLIRSEFFLTMFDSPFREAQTTPHLQIIPIDCSPAVLEIILAFLYTEKSDFGLDIAIDVLFAADMLFLEKLKTKAAVVISALGTGTGTNMATLDAREDETMDIYELLRAAWTTRVQRLEEFAARYIAYRLESYIDDPAFAEIVKESASRISARQDTDTIEILDDIRYYLSERFRLRFEDIGFDEAVEIAEAAELAETSELEAVQRSAEDVVGNQRKHIVTDTNSKAQHNDEKVGSSTSSQTSTSSNSTGTSTSKTSTSNNSNTNLLSASPSPRNDHDGVLRPFNVTVNGEQADERENDDDDFASDAQNYRLLLGKIDTLLERLKLDA